MQQTGDDEVVRRSAEVRRWKRTARTRRYRLHAVLAMIVILLVTCITLQTHNGLSALIRGETERGSTHSSVLWSLSKKHAKVESSLPRSKDQCENIYSHKDQCKFVLKSCEESEVGMIHYLKFYFCTLGNVRPVAFILMILWAGLLFSAIGIAASDFFCPNLATLAQTLRMSESMAGVTFLALGNGSPDLFSTFSAMRVGSGSLAIGELIGAAFFINAVVAGSMAIVRPFKVSRKSFVRDVLFFAGAVAFSVGLLADGMITTWESGLMVAYYGVYVFFVVMATWYWGSRSKRRRTESRARHHYRDEVEEQLPEGEEDDERTTANEGTLLLGDVRDLEENAVEDEDQELERVYADLQHKMSLVRPTLDGRRSPAHHGHASIRPSLFGALEFRSLSTKLASASALQRRHSVAQPGSRSGFTLHRNNSDPFSVARTAPPRHQPNAPWRTSDGHGRTASEPTADYFNYPGSARRVPSPAIHLIAEDDTDRKSSPYLLPPQPEYGGKRPSSSPRLHINTSEDALILPSPTIPLQVPTPSESLEFRDTQEQASLTSPIYPRRYRWWPNFLLPDPYLLYITLFPTLRDFRSKTWFQRTVAILAIPAVFCLTITLPVIDNETIEDEDEIKFPLSPNSILHGVSAVEGSPAIRPMTPNSEVVMVMKSWNRWLTGLQCLCAPIFLTFIFFQDEDLLVPMLYALTAGLVMLALVNTFSSPDKPPKWHKALCVIGFIVAIAWISTIADEVVGLLRAFGAIMGVSEAILGVTVFAMGNSLSDFVADVTVARMGYPMMAMSACFGGPMLNILLGVGVSGLYMNLTTEPEYRISISPTLLVSTISLFITLTSMLIIVPWMKWRMTRPFGIYLVAFFTISTIASVLVEIIF